ncbi:hypothetical protein LINPERPRIM_LOCUS612, partial [Linum perenne]
QRERERKWAEEQSRAAAAVVVITQLRSARYFTGPEPPTNSTSPTTRDEKFGCVIEEKKSGFVLICCTVHYS